MGVSATVNVPKGFTDVVVVDDDDPTVTGPDVTGPADSPTTGWENGAVVGEGTPESLPIELSALATPTPPKRTTPVVNAIDRIRVFMGPPWLSSLSQASARTQAMNGKKRVRSGFLHSSFRGDIRWERDHT
jgi:hypothetical protein